MTAADLRAKAKVLIDDCAEYGYFEAAEKLTAFVEAMIDAADALDSIKGIAWDAHAAWDADKDSRVGKILIALCGRAPGYRRDTDRIHAALSRLEELAK